MVQKIFWNRVDNRFFNANIRIVVEEIVMKAVVKKPVNVVAKDLFSPKYRSRIVSSKKHYNRKRDKRNFD